jgi:Flp pilus assembly protein TadD
MRVIPVRIGRLLASVAVAAIACGILAGCNTTRGPETTGSIGTPPPAGDWRQQAVVLGERYRANPNDPNLAIAYGQALRMIGQREQAVAVLEQASIRQPHDLAILGAYGRALADVGRYQQALDVLSHAHTPEQPDWRILSAQGAVLDQIGRHQEAQRYYASALRLQPNDAAVLSNLGLSYALSKDLVRAEQTLRQAAALRPPDPRVRQNLALVVGLQGRFAEAEHIAQADLPPAEAAANVAYLRQMLAQQQQPPQNAQKTGSKSAPYRPAARQANPYPAAAPLTLRDRQS